MCAVAQIYTKDLSTMIDSKQELTMKKVAIYFASGRVEEKCCSLGGGQQGLWLLDAKDVRWYTDDL